MMETKSINNKKVTVRPKRTITSKEKQLFLDLQPDDINLQKLTDLFVNVANVSPDGKIHVNQSKFNTYDEFTLEANEYINKEKIITNCGLFIVNKFLIEPFFAKEIGYVNWELSKSGISKLDKMISVYVQEDETDEYTRKFIKYKDRMCWLQFVIITQLCTSLDLESITPNKKVMQQREKLLKENAEAIKNADVVTFDKNIQSELLKTAANELKDSPAMELYTSGARGSFDNAYRQWLCSIGPVWNESKKTFEIIPTSLHEGISKDSIPVFANMVVSAYYPKSIGTGECGYTTKQITAAMQTVELDDRDSDCGTTQCSTVTITPDNINYYMYQYIKVGDKYVRLDNSTKQTYMGKTVQIRTTDYCCGDKLCNRCAGDRYYMLGIKNIGLTLGRLSNSMLNYKMKKAHDATVRTVELDPNTMFHSM